MSTNLKETSPLTAVLPNFRIPVGNPATKKWDTIDLDTFARIMGESLLAPYTRAYRVLGSDLGARRLSEIVEETPLGVVIVGTGDLRILPAMMDDEADNYFVYEMGYPRSIIGVGPVPLLVKEADFTDVPDARRGDLLVFIR